MTPRLMNVELASHLSREPSSEETRHLLSEEHHQRFYPEDISREMLGCDWSVWTIPGLWLAEAGDECRRRFVTGHRSSFTPILDTTRVRFPLHKPSLSLSTLTIPLLQKCRAASFRFMNHFSMKMIELQTRGIQFELKDYRTHFILHPTI